MDEKSIRDAVSLGRTFYLEELTYDLLDASGCKQSVLPIPEDFDERIQAFGNLLAQMCCNIRGKDGMLLVELRTLSAALSYLLNSTSYATGEYQKFDKIEIDRKLRRK